jgi:hypothetical protein
MVTILRPRRHRPDESRPEAADGTSAEGEQNHDGEKGIELSEDEDGIGTAGEPGEGPNPTA